MPPDYSGTDTNSVADLGELLTETVADPWAMLDALSVSDLAARINDRDATIAAAVRSALPTISRAIEATSERMRRGGRLVYVGAGTSGRLGILDASEVPPTFGTNADVVIGVIAGGSKAIVSSVEAAEDDEAAGAAAVAELSLSPIDTIVGIASSGRTPYVLGAVRSAAQIGALTVGLSCNPHTPLSALAEYGIEILVGPEILTGSTRMGAGTGTKMVLNMFSTITMIQLGKTYGSLMVDVKATNKKLTRRAIRIVQLAAGVDEEAARAVLDESDWNAKVAIAMAATGMTASEARDALDAAGGVLGRVIPPGQRPATKDGA